MYLLTSYKVKSELNGQRTAIDFSILNKKNKELTSTKKKSKFRSFFYILLILPSFSWALNKDHNSTQILRPEFISLMSNQQNIKNPYKQDGFSVQDSIAEPGFTTTFLDKYDEMTSDNYNVSKYQIFLLYAFGINATVLFILIVYLNKYKKLVNHLRELKANQKELTNTNTFLSRTKAELKRTNELNHGQVEILNETYLNMRNQHSRMIEFIFELEKIIKDRTETINSLNRQIFNRNKQVEKINHLLFNKGMKSISKMRSYGPAMLLSEANKLHQNELSIKLHESVEEMDACLKEIKQINEQS